MSYIDLPLDELRAYRPALEPPADLAAFWAATLADARRHDLAATFTPVATGLALIGSTLRSAFRIDDVNQTPPLAPLVDPAEMLQQEQALAGTFATGDDEGDRAIVIDVGGKVSQQELGAHGTVQLETAGTYRLGRRDRTLYLAIANGGQIEVTNRDTLVYYRDTYRRVH